ncbi:WD40 repeat-like protein [Pluteus cervinus]|uniref:WD40 repeat-like protein n=1 Tax=Pluteus cervinus TaxID=181527 RepID=A0ACD3BI88_9AGAR|nr:WD40 repeat-like protein [Pluteus cervinus]
MFYCALSGEAPVEPVVSAKSGKVYERRLIIKYIAENGTDPLSGDKLEESDLIPIKASPQSAPPRPPSLTSIPAILHTLQNEWDAAAIEKHALLQQHNSLRQELSNALYSLDAATRTIARLIRERDAAREALANIHATMGIAPSAPAAGDVEMNEDAGAAASEETLPATILAQIDETHQALSAARKKRKPPPGYATAADVKTFALKHTIPSLHSASPAGVNSLVVSRLNPTQFLTGGNDKVVQLYDRATDKVLATLKGHTKKINHVVLREKEGEPTLIASGGADKICKIWGYDSASSEYLPKSTIKSHKGEITGLAVHPTSTILTLASADRTFSIHDLSNFSQVYRSSPADEALSSLAIHPDGTLIAFGTPTSTIQIYDIRSGSVAASLTPPEATPFTVNTLSFSENGYHLLAPNSLNTVAVWDLRKQLTTKTFTFEGDPKVHSVRYDLSAQFLGVAGNFGLKVYAHKTWEEIGKFAAGDDVSDLAYGAEGKEIWSVGGREVKIWGLPA